MPLTKVQSRGTENVGQGSSNVIINGAMNIAQRSTSETNRGDDTGYYVVDRWKLSTGASTAGRLTLSQDSSAPSGFANSTKFDCTTADTSIASGEFLQFEQLIEGQNLQAFAKGTADAKPFAVSFYVKGNASATYVCELFDADNSRQISKTFNVTTDWTRVELTFPADTTGAFDDDNASSLALVIHLNAGSNYTSGTINSGSWASSTNANRVGSGTTSFFDSTDRTFFITGVQLEVGSQASDFQHEDIGTTLQKCQRYYQEIELSTTFRQVGTQEYADFFPFHAVMRASPTASVVTQFKYWDGGIPTNFTPGFVTLIGGSSIVAPNLSTSGNGFQAGKASFSSEL